jgi:hypothetical protein
MGLKIITTKFTSIKQKCNLYAYKHRNIKSVKLLCVQPKYCHIVLSKKICRMNVLSDWQVLKRVLRTCNRKEWFAYTFLPLWLPCSMVRGPMWLVMSVSTYPGWTAFTMRSSRGSASNARCCIKLRALTATLDTEYAELGQPSCWCLPLLALLQIQNEAKKAYTISSSKTLHLHQNKLCCGCETLNITINMMYLKSFSLVL